MKTKKLIAFSICLNIGFVIVAAYTGIRYVMHKHMDIHTVSQSFLAFENLELNSDQKTKIDQMVQVYLQSSKAAHDKALEKTIDFLGLLAAPGQPTADKIETSFQVIMEAEAAKESIRLNHLKAIKQVLTDQQAEKFFQHLLELY